MKKLFSHLVSCLVSVTFLAWSILPALAIGPISQIGPSGTIGADQGLLGPQTPVGPQSPTGPQGLSGPSGPTGPQGVVGRTSNSAPDASSPSANHPEPSAASTPSVNAGPTGSPISEASQPVPAQTVNQTTDTSAVNHQTGANSSNSSSVSQDSTTKVERNSQESITNNITGQSSTGNNQTNANTGSGEINSGPITGMVNVLNLANSQIVAQSGGLTQQTVGDSSQDIVIGQSNLSNTVPLPAIVLGDLGGSLKAGNDTTGANSQNQASVERIGDTTIRVSNDSAVNNAVNLTADSGNNQASQNTGLGRIVTGAINIATNIVNFLNTFITTDYLGLAFLNVVGALSGDVIIPDSPSATSSNASTGANSANQASVASSRSFQVSTDSQANVQNQINVDAQTGNNQADRNTLTGAVSTGQTDVNIQSATVTGDIPSDSLLLVVVNEIGDGQWTGQVVGSPDNVIVLVKKAEPATQLEAINTNTGANSLNQASVSQDNNVDLSQTDRALVTNSINVKASTGNNQSNDNTGGGSIKSGDIRVAGGLVNFVNTTGTALKKVVVAVINVFGRWTGNLVFGAKKSQVIATPSTTQPAEPASVLKPTPALPSSTDAAIVSISVDSSTTQSVQASTVQSTVPSIPASDASVSQSESVAQASQASISKQISPSRRVTVQTTPAAEDIDSTLAEADSRLFNQSGQSTNLPPVETQSARLPNWSYAVIIIVAALVGVTIAYSSKKLTSGDQ